MSAWFFTRCSVRHALPTTPEMFGLIMGRRVEVVPVNPQRCDRYLDRQGTKLGDVEEDVNIGTAIVPNLDSIPEFRVFTSNVLLRGQAGRDSKVVRESLRGPTLPCDSVTFL